MTEITETVKLKKIGQGYRKIPDQCQNCKQFRFELSDGRPKKLRCGIGGFAVNRTAVCDLWVKK